MTNKQRQKHLSTIIALGVSLVFIVLMGLSIVISGCGQNVKDIKLHARRASVQPLFYIPVLKVSFTSPLAEDEEITSREDIEKLLKTLGVTKEDFEQLLTDKNLTQEDLDKLVEEKIEKALEAERVKAEQEKEKYDEFLTNIEKCRIASPSQTEIPLGIICPDWARFPERVLVVYKVEKKEISAWEREYEEDVLTIAETANVAPSRAKTIITTLKTQGYSVSKEEVDTESEVKLLWFDNGWNDNYPTELDWKVVVEGTEANLITGYDPRGILTVRPIPGDKQLCIKAGYFDLKDEFKPKPREVEILEGTVKFLEKRIDDKEREQEEQRKATEKKLEAKDKELEELEDQLEKEKGVSKRDISTVTWMDVRCGCVKVERLWMISGGTGTFLGNMEVREEFTGYQGGYGHRHFVGGEKKAVILTNAHVAEAVVTFDVQVSKDKEVMWIIYPGLGQIRHTQDSDLFGTPAQLLCYDNKPILSNDYDTAILVSTAVPGFERNKAFLGNSDNVQQGDEIVLVGNPGLLQKFTAEGIISNLNYSLLKYAAPFLIKLPKAVLNKLMNITLWYDAEPTKGGSSGSGVWALTGSEAGKVIGLHAMGIRQPLSIAKASMENKEFDVRVLGLGVDENEALLSDPNKVGNTQIKTNARDLFELLFKDYPHKEAKFQFSAEEIAEETPSFKTAMRESGKWVSVPGMSAGIPINKVKTYLQERGLDPNHFGWEASGKEYWEK